MKRNSSKISSIVGINDDDDNDDELPWMKESNEEEEELTEKGAKGGSSFSRTFDKDDDDDKDDGADENDDDDDDDDGVMNDSGKGGPRKKTGKKGKGGGFQTMGLSWQVLKGVLEKGYRVPTPIQRKVIPLAMKGLDVVAMARTGSGKTAAFLVPMLQRLQTHSPHGIRALILSPTREIAIQTLKFSKALGKLTDLQQTLVVGGDGLESQFAALGMSPDVVVATPGRFWHLIQEMSLSLTSVEMVIFDEADRLFEMGFAEQLKTIIKALPETRQTLLVSATLPAVLVQFAKAGLHDPEMVRLDVDTRLSPDLQNIFVSLAASEKAASLVHVLLNSVLPQVKASEANGASKDKKLIMIFVSTKHHVEYLTMVLKALSIDCVGIYGAMDQGARVRALQLFRRGEVQVMVVTDVAARGIDIPLLDFVINYDFPAEPKLYVHRAGRVARAGRPGVAISFVAHDELPYALDLMLYLSQELHGAKPEETYDSSSCVIGTLPRTPVERFIGEISSTQSLRLEIATAFRSMNNAIKMYTKTRPLPSAASVQRAKDMAPPSVHPYFAEHYSSEKEAQTEAERRKLLDGIKSFRPKATIFEVCNVERTPALEAMENARREMAPSIERFHKHLEEVREEEIQREKRRTGGRDDFDGLEEETKAKEDGEKPSSSVPTRKMHKRKGKVIGEKTTKSAAELRKEEQQKNFLSALPPVNHNYEKALEIKGDAVQDAVFGLTMDDEDDMKKDKLVRKWDRRKKKYVVEHGGVETRGATFTKTERGEKGATPDGSLYEKWLNKTRAKRLAAEGGAEENQNSGEPAPKRAKKGHVKSELKSFEQIRKTHMKEAWRKKSRSEKRKLSEKRLPAFTSKHHNGMALRGGKGRKQH